MKLTGPAERGFALVVTISLMVLLSLLAVGFLGLSTVALRSSGQDQAMAQARGNARMALVMALGELQKHAGTDKAVTAPIELIQQQPKASRLTGVWSSWDQLETDSGGAPDYESRKGERFRTWLVSDSEGAAVAQRDYSGPSGETIQLVGPGSLGVPNPAPEDLVRAGRVRLADAGNKPVGAFAWHVADESQKARINAYRDPRPNALPWWKSSLLAGHRPHAGVVKGADGSTLSFLPDDADAAGFVEAEQFAGKLVSTSQFELLPSGGSIGPFRHHVTPHSYGLLTDVRRGGLKQDLTSIFEMPTMPQEYNGKRIYESTHGLTGISDPNWSVLKDYYGLGTDPALNGSDPLYRQSPREAVRLSDSRNVPRYFYAAPVIARVEMLFSVVARDAHGPWAPKNTHLTQHTKMIHLLYAPIITLHNPYNVSIQFDQMDIDINGIPIAFNFFVNGEAQNFTTVPYNQMYVSLDNRASKSFNLSISNWGRFGSSTSSPITMSPGQSLVCGPYIDGSTAFGSDGNAASQIFFDYRNDLTGNAGARAKCKPGFLGPQVSYDIDWITPDNGPFSTDGRRGVLIVRDRDRFHIEFQMKPNEFNGQVTDSMSVSAKIKAGRREMEIGGMDFKYDTRSINKLYPEVHRFPDARSRPNQLSVLSIYHDNFSPISTHNRVQAFALVSGRQRTANGGVYDSVSRDERANGENLLTDGILAGIPLLHHNPARTPTVVDLGRDVPGRYSHELSLEPLNGSVADLFDIDTRNRGYLLTANKSTNGVKSGTYLELPTGPMQTIADFRRSNTLTSSMLPNFVQPLSNSYSSPLIPTDQIIAPNVVSYPLLDHSVLANHAFYDRFYFSTFANYGGANTPDQVFSSFMEGTRPLASQSFEPYLPPGATIEDIRGELFGGGRPGADTYREAARYQLVRTPFNVNSVDVEAWKAVLSSLKGETIQQLWAATGDRDETPAEQTPIVPMSMVTGGAVGKFNPGDTPKTDNELTSDFNGYQDLEPAEIEELAEAIVRQVRARGPFLSLAEFVNRQIGESSPETLVGALQAAIDESGINDDFLLGHVLPVRLEDVGDKLFYNFPNLDASVGNPAAGAPGWLMQGDLMRLLEPGVTVRGDTFVIRTCGQALDVSGEIRATAYLEAVVQRFPEYLDPADDAAVNVWDPAESDTSEINRRFGRRFELVSFRWLSSDEI